MGGIYNILEKDAVKQATILILFLRYKQFCFLIFLIER